MNPTQHSLYNTLCFLASSVLVIFCYDFSGRTTLLLSRKKEHFRYTASSVASRKSPVHRAMLNHNLFVQL